MFNQQYHSMMFSNRALEKSLKHFQATQIQNFEYLQNVNDYILYVLQMIDQKILRKEKEEKFKKELKKETKYIIKKIIDLYALKFAPINFEEFPKAAFSLVFMVVKFMEDPEIQQKFFKFLFGDQNSGFDFEFFESFSKFEIKIFKDPEFSFIFTTPYDYLGLYRQAFLLDKIMVERIERILSFSLSIPELMFASAEELFFGSMLMVGEQKNFETQWILLQTFSRTQVQNLSRIIKQCYYSEIEAIQIEAIQN